MLERPLAVLSQAFSSQLAESHDPNLTLYVLYCCARVDCNASIPRVLILFT